MRNDLYFGALVSLGVHIGLAISNRTSLPPPVRLVADDAPVIRLVQRLDEIIEPTVSEDEKPNVQEVLTRPSQTDFPREIKPNDFAMKVQPPMPENAQIDRGLITIPPGTGGISHGDGNVINLLDLDRPPIAKFQVQPQYPFEMKRGGFSGEVLVEFIVEANGAVRDARAVRSSQREFEAAAALAVGKWTFRPGQKGGRNVATRMQVPIVFTLNEERD